MDLLRKKSDWPVGKSNRRNIIRNIRDYFVINTMETLAITYKIKDLLEYEQEVIYCIGYVGIEKNRKHYLDYIDAEYMELINAASELYFQAISPSGSSISKDGEYRSVLINWDITYILIRNDAKLYELYHDMKTYLTGQLKDRKYFLMMEYFYPTDILKKTYTFELELISGGDTKIRFFMLSWFNFYFNYHYAVISSHINEIFIKLMLKYQNKDHAFFKKMIEKHGETAIFKFMYMTNNYILDLKQQPVVDITQKYKLGQKIIPLNLLEAQHPFNICYAAWKEYYLSKKASDLVVNEITPGFALFAGWMFIKTNRSIYDNPEHKERLDRSRIAEKITETLTQAQTYTYHHLSAGQKQQAGTSWLSAEFKKLYYMIRDSIQHAKNNIIMSNVSFNIMTEYLGRTLYDSAHLAKDSKHFQKYFMSIVADENYYNFRRYMFEVCYNIYCMNSKMSAIHGDLHLNNIILNLIVYIQSVPNYRISGRRIVYVVDGRPYLFPFNFYYISVIDFSRSILHYDHTATLLDPVIPKLDTVNQEEFRRSQVHALLNYLILSKPVYKERQHQIEDYIRDNYDACFKLLSVLDLFNFLSRFIDFIKSKEISGVSKKVVTMLEDMFLFTDRIVSNEFQEMLDMNTADVDKDQKWPALRAIEQFFRPEQAEDADLEAVKEDIVDFYDDCRKVDYTIDTLPDLPKPSKLWEARISRNKRQTQKNFEIVNIIMNRQREKHP